MPINLKYSVATTVISYSEVVEPPTSADIQTMDDFDDITVIMNRSFADTINRDNCLLLPESGTIEFVINRSLINT